MPDLRVRLVTPWGTACGIAEHSKMLVEAVQQVDPAITFDIDDSLNPGAFWYAGHVVAPPDVLLLNYHAALHSQWTAAEVQKFKGFYQKPAVVVYHDTGVPNSEQCHALHAVADRCIVHEPCGDLPGAVYLRQGVPEPQYPMLWGVDDGTPREYVPGYPRTYWHQPLLGTVGFPFPWKNYDLLAAATAEAGWALLLLAPGATEAQVVAWRDVNPALLAVTDFIPAEAVVAYLAGCDATAFLYTCANTGTSGAIRQGIAARKPVLATYCRQFRDLQLDVVGQAAIRWVDDLSPAGVATQLAQVPMGRVDAGIVRLAERDSWRGVGARYAAILREVVREGVGEVHRAR